MLCTAAGIHDLIGKHYSRDALEAADASDAADPIDALTAASKGVNPANPAGAKQKVAGAAREPLTAEQKKQRLQITIVSFNMTVALTAVLLSSRLCWGSALWPSCWTALPAAAIVAGIVWVTRG